jgi:hypothetical protein
MAKQYAQMRFLAKKVIIYNYESGLKAWFLKKFIHREMCGVFSK